MSHFREPEADAAVRWRAALNPMARALVDEQVAELARHPRFVGRQFGEQSALHLMHRLCVYLDEHPGIKWPMQKDVDEQTLPQPQLQRDLCEGEAASSTGGGDDYD